MAMRSADGRATVDGPGLSEAANLPVEILESKLYRPGIRPGVVPRPQLIARLQAAGTVSTVAVVAPAGYGKTTLLALWSGAEDRPFAWLSLDRHDNDPVVLLTHLAVALDRINPLPDKVFAALRSVRGPVTATVIARLGSALARSAHPLVLVLDDVHHLHDGPSLDALVTLVGHVRGRTQIALAGRAMPVPLARDRARGRMIEIGPQDLAFTEDGARALLRAAGVDLPDEDLVALTRRTEGWAAVLYLAAISPSPGKAAGDHPLVAEYLQSELLAGLSPQDLSFLTRTAVLDRLSGPLCDAVLEEQGSAHALERLQRSNLFLVPLDEEHRWYRYHTLFRDLLREQPGRPGPEEALSLLRRAAEWCEADGQLEQALHYAQEGEDVDRVARIAITLAQRMYAAGRSETLMGWFEWVDSREAIGRHPAIAALAALLCTFTGRPAAAERWADIAERCARERSPGDGDPRFAVWLVSVRGIMCRRGVDQMRRDVDGLQATGPAVDTEYAFRLFLSGVANLLLGDVDTADARFLDALELTDQMQRTPFYSAVLAYRALLCQNRGDWKAAEPLVTQAQSIAHRSRTGSHLASALVLAVAARAALNRFDLDLARLHLGEAQRLRPLLTYAIPWFSVEALLLMAEVAAGLGDVSGGQVLLRDADAVIRRRPDLGALVGRTHGARQHLATLGTGSVETVTLTAAELRVLPLLETHLTLARIADRLFLSRHTVKAQVESVYRKLEVHTRDDAIVRARKVGLLDS